jgi:hypothetical protein
MQFDLTSKSVREFADRVVQAHSDINKQLALEVAAHGFGYRNFDALSGVLKTTKSKGKPGAEGTQDTQRLQADAPVHLGNPVPLWVEGFVIGNDFVLFDWLKVELTETLVSHILKRRELCIENGLLHVSEDVRPADWSKNDEISVINDWQLFVSPDRFWFRGHPKHATYAVEGRAVHFDDLFPLLELETAGEKSFRWISGGLYKHSTDAQLLLDALTETLDIGFREPASEEDARARLGQLESMLVFENLDDALQAEIRAEIVELEAWLRPLKKVQRRCRSVRR